MTSEEMTALILARGDGDMQVGKGDRIEVDSIVEEESVRPADALDMGCWVEERQRLK